MKPIEQTHNHLSDETPISLVDQKMENDKKMEENSQTGKVEETQQQETQSVTADEDLQGSIDDESSDELASNFAPTEPKDLARDWVENAIITRSITRQSLSLMSGAIMGVDKDAVCDFVVYFRNDDEACSGLDSKQTLLLLNTNRESEIAKIPITLYDEGCRTKSLGSITIHCVSPFNKTWGDALESFQFSGGIKTSNLERKNGLAKNPFCYYKKFNNKPWIGPLHPMMTLQEIGLEFKEGLEHGSTGKHNNIALFWI
eukprot:332389_1